MTHKDILQKAIEKALANGWSKDLSSHFLTTHPNLDDAMIYGQFIWDHDFAKALWGENTHEVSHLRIKYNYVQVFDRGLSWQYHLQQMVIADDPIQYLGDNLP